MPLNINGRVSPCKPVSTGITFKASGNEGSIFDKNREKIVAEKCGKAQAKGKSFSGLGKTVIDETEIGKEDSKDIS
jgi:hypothetical protein